MNDGDFKTLYHAMISILPTQDPGDGYSLWNNNGIVTKSTKQ